MGDRPARLRVNEIFHSIQGEGTRAGMRCVFIRLTGCHLRCSYCDTEYAFYEGTWRTLPDILADVRAFRCDFVELTGGEPLLQPAAIPLLKDLLREFPTVALETSGALSIAEVPTEVVRIIDLKTPSSGEVQRNCWDNLTLLTPNDEVKFVIGTRADYEWARNVVGEYGLTSRCPVLFSPVTGLPPAARSTLKLYQGGLSAQQLAEWIVADGLNVRCSLQLHKLIWSPTARGV